MPNYSPKNAMMESGKQPPMGLGDLMGAGFQNRDKSGYQPMVDADVSQLMSQDFQNRDRVSTTRCSPHSRKYRSLRTKAFTLSSPTILKGTRLSNSERCCTVDRSRCLKVRLNLLVRWMYTVQCWEAKTWDVVQKQYAN